MNKHSKKCIHGCTTECVHVPAAKTQQDAAEQERKVSYDPTRPLSCDMQRPPLSNTEQLVQLYAAHQEQRCERLLAALQDIAKVECLCVDCQEFAAQKAKAAIAEGK